MYKRDDKGLRNKVFNKSLSVKVKKFVIFGDEEFDVVDNNNLKRNGVSSIDDIINKVVVGVVGVVGLVVISIFELIFDGSLDIFKLIKERIDEKSLLLNIIKNVSDIKRIGVIIERSKVRGLNRIDEIETI